MPAKMTMEVKLKDSVDTSSSVRKKDNAATVVSDHSSYKISLGNLALSVIHFK